MEVLRSGWLARGDKTARFEKEFSSFVKARHAVALNSCTAALHLALIAAEIGPGDEVITTPFTFAATANTIIHTGATVVFVDIDPATLNISVPAIRSSLTEKTKAILPMHFGGRPCDMEAISDIAQQNGLIVIEDAAHAMGASCQGEIIGSISPLTAFSFYATKNMTTGEGGMLTTDDDRLAARARRLSQHGMSCDAWMRYGKDGHSYYEVEEPGYKYNMFDLQAAIGLVQLKKSVKMRSRRRRISAIYDEELSDCSLVRLLDTAACDGHAHHLYTVLLESDSLDVSRDKIASTMQQHNVGVSVHFRSLHLHPYYRNTYGFEKDDFPAAAEASRRVLSLPLYPGLSEKGARIVATTLKAVVERHAG